MEAMQGISGFLLKSEKGRKSFLKVFGGLPQGWKNTILAACEKGIPDLHKLLKAT